MLDLSAHPGRRGEKIGIDEKPQPTEKVPAPRNHFLLKRLPGPDEKSQTIHQKPQQKLKMNTTGAGAKRPLPLWGAAEDGALFVFKCLVDFWCMFFDFSSGLGSIKVSWVLERWVLNPINEFKLLKVMQKPTKNN